MLFRAHECALYLLCFLFNLLQIRYQEQIRFLQGVKNVYKLGWFFEVHLLFIFFVLRNLVLI